jgi:hypothetical protein
MLIPPISTEEQSLVGFEYEQIGELICKGFAQIGDLFDVVSAEVLIEVVEYPRPKNEFTRHSLGGGVWVRALPGLKLETWGSQCFR